MPKTCSVPDCPKPTFARGWCSMHYTRMRVTGSLAAPAPRVPQLGERLWGRIDKEGPDGCWVWRGALNAAGYGVIGYGQKILRVHRLVYETLIGPIPKPQLDHLCRNRACCNPAHLEPVTNRENWRRGQHLTAVTVRTGVCKRGHDFEAEAAVRPNGSRYCKACARVRRHERTGR